MIGSIMMVAFIPFAAEEGKVVVVSRGQTDNNGHLLNVFEGNLFAIIRLNSL